jgi:hypothetical protein
VASDVWLDFVSRSEVSRQSFPVLGSETGPLQRST